MVHSRMDTQWCIITVTRIVSDLANYDGGRCVGVDLLDAYHVQLELVYCELIGMEVLGGLSNAVSVDRVREALRIVKCMLQDGSEVMEMGYHAPAIHDGSEGRPRLNIPRNQLAYMLERRFTAPQIAGILRVSVRTIRRRMSEYELSVHALYSQLTDHELDVLVSDIQTQFPTCGNRQMQGHLLARGIRVQQHQVRESQRRTDPCGSVMRRLRAINRRQYQVDGPGALWHIDGNHKLIRFVKLI